MENPAKKKAFKDHLEGITDGYLEVAFTGTVRKDMDAMFRRTGRRLFQAQNFVMFCAYCGAEHTEWVSSCSAGCCFVTLLLFNNFVVVTQLLLNLPVFAPHVHVCG